MNKIIIIIATLIIFLAGLYFLYAKLNPGTNSLQETRILDLSNKKLDKVPEYVFNDGNLESLNLSNNRLTGAIPGEIRKLSKLKNLDLSNNLLTGVPAEVGQLSNLEVLNLSYNDITGLPNELGNLKKLKILNLVGTNYSQVDLDVILKGLPSNVIVVK